MGVRKPFQKKPYAPVNVEQQVIAFADQVGWSLGTIRAKAEGWRNSEAVRTEVARIRDGAVRLLEHFKREPEPPPKAAPPRAVTSKPRVDRGLVEAKQVGQGVKNSPRRGRG